MKETTNVEFHARWDKPVNRIGLVSLVMAMILSFLPFLYLVIFYDAMPPASALGLGLFSALSAYIVNAIVESIAYFPVLGIAGSYMALLAGSIGNMRVPACMVAKASAGVEDNTEEGELVATCGIAGSVFLNLIVTTLTAICGTVIVSILPEVIISALSAYILPGIFGALMAMMINKHGFKFCAPILAVALLLRVWIKFGSAPAMVSKLAMLLVVVLGVLITRFRYKRGMLG